MGRKLTLLDKNGAVLCTIGTADDSMLLTNVLRKRADSLSANSPASIAIGSGDSAVTYSSRYGGLCWNACTVEHTPGPTGSGNENRPLGVSVVGVALTVSFGTDGNGDSIVPTANQVRDLVNGDPDASAVMIATAGGTGAGQAATQAPTTLSGGLDNGDWLKFEGLPPTVCRISKVEIV